MAFSAKKLHGKMARISWPFLAFESPETGQYGGECCVMAAAQAELDALLATAATTQGAVFSANSEHAIVAVVGYATRYALLCQRLDTNEREQLMTTYVKQYRLREPQYRRFCIPGFLCTLRTILAECQRARCGFLPGCLLFDSNPVNYVSSFKVVESIR